MSKPRLLDLFCGAGGAARGYQMAGFEVTGVDINPQPRYAGDVFIQGEALEYVAVHGREYDAIHASPPCQGYSIMRNLPWWRHKEYPLLIEPTRALLEVSGRPWVIENVMGAKLPAGWLCGTMFGLPFFRHRYFESGGWLWLQPSHAAHAFVIRPSGSRGSRAIDVVATREKNGAQRVGANVGHAAGVGLVRQAMGIDWMRRDELTQAIPPAYTAFVGGYLLRQVVASQEVSRG